LISKERSLTFYDKFYGFDIDEETIDESTVFSPIQHALDL